MGKGKGRGQSPPNYVGVIKRSSFFVELVIIKSTRALMIKRKV